MEVFWSGALWEELGQAEGLGLGGVGVEKRGVGRPCGVEHLYVWRLKETFINQTGSSSLHII